MKYFKLIKTDLEIQPLLDEINHHQNPWTLHEGRQSKIKVQREAQSIPLRGLVKSKIQGRKRCDVHESRFTTISSRFPFAIAFLKRITLNLNGVLSRAKLVNLPSGSRVYSHIDRGEYYKIRDRYHLILQSGPEGSYLKSGDEDVRMKPGELWWFDNKQSHESYNDSDQDRIHLIFDLLPTNADACLNTVLAKQIDLDVV